MYAVADQITFKFMFMCMKVLGDIQHDSFRGPDHTDLRSGLYVNLPK